MIGKITCIHTNIPRGKGDAEQEFRKRDAALNTGQQNGASRRRAKEMAELERETLLASRPLTDQVEWGLAERK